jgi:response regulator NasT
MRAGHTTTGSAADPRPRLILIVDRDERNRSAVAAVLAEDGFEIAGLAGDPRQAPGLTRDRNPDAIVLAVAGTDDLRVLAEVTAERIAPVVVLGDADPAKVAGARDTGAHAYLPASPTRSVLVPAVELAIARFAEITRLTAEVHAAEQRLQTRKLVDRAKGLLMTHRGMTEPEAFRWIQRSAMDRRKSSAAIAAQVITEFAGSGLREAS